MANGKKTDKEESGGKSGAKSKVSICEAQRVLIITYLRRHSNLLFGELAMTNQRIDQRQGWQDCLDYCLSIKAHYRTVKHLQDTINGWKRALKIKMARCKKTGEGAQPPTTESEEQLFNLIIGSKKLTKQFKVIEI
jgi:hypothetical protein